MLQKVTRLDSVPTAEETVLTTEVPMKESRLYTLLHKRGARLKWVNKQIRKLQIHINLTLHIYFGLLRIHHMMAARHYSVSY